MPSELDPDAKPPYPTLGHTLLLLLLLMVLLVIGVAAASGVLRSGSSSAQIAVWGMIQLLRYGIVLAIGLRMVRAPVEEVLPLRPLAPRLLVPIALVAVGLTILGSEANNLLQLVFPYSSEDLARLESGEPNAAALILTVVVVTPVCEELFWRGLVLRGLRLNYGSGPAILAMTALFAISYLTAPRQIAMYLATGLFAGWLVVRTQSLTAALFAALVGNGGAVAIQLAGIIIPGFTAPMTTEVTFQPWWLNMGGAAALAIGLGLLVLLPKDDADHRSAATNPKPRV